MRLLALWGTLAAAVALASPCARGFQQADGAASRSTIMGRVLGEGGRAVAELMYADFMGRAGDEIFNQLSKWQAMSAGQLQMPVVLRVSVGSKYGAQHSQDFTALVHHIPGLKVVYPVTPYDAKGMLNAALAGTDPVIFFESQKVYDAGEMFEREGRPADRFPRPWANENAARAQYNAVPPDLSVIAKARSYERGFPWFIVDAFTQYQEHGVDYLTALFQGYEDKPPAGVSIPSGLSYNKYFPGGAIAMLVLAMLVAVIVALWVSRTDAAVIDWVVGYWHRLVVWVQGLIT